MILLCRFVFVLWFQIYSVSQKSLTAPLRFCQNLKGMVRSHKQTCMNFFLFRNWKGQICKEFCCLQLQWNFKKVQKHYKAIIKRDVVLWSLTIACVREQIFISLFARNSPYLDYFESKKSVDEVYKTILNDSFMNLNWSDSQLPDSVMSD